MRNEGKTEWSYIFQVITLFVWFINHLPTILLSEQTNHHQTITYLSKLNKSYVCGALVIIQKLNAANL
jgi:hypothetical protein